MLTFSQELAALMHAVSHRAIDIELERKKSRRTCRSLRIFEDNHARVLADLAGKPARSVNEIARSVGLKPSTIRSHLRTLLAEHNVEQLELNSCRHLFVIPGAPDAQA